MESLSQSEIILIEFIDRLYVDSVEFKLELVPSLDNTIIDSLCTNICNIKTEYRNYSVGGISEKVYDYLINYYNNN